MPISIAEVTKAFVTMKSYGLEPTTKMMENLVNVASLLPESGRAMTGIARAMGQIQAKGRLEGQELRQLAEWAVPGYEAVYTKIFEKMFVNPSPWMANINTYDRKKVQEINKFFISQM